MSKYPWRVIIQFPIETHSNIPSCMKFLETYNEAKDLVESRESHERNLQAKGFVLMPGDIGYAKSRNSLYSSPSYFVSDPRESDIMTTTAKLIADRNQSELSSFEAHAVCFDRFVQSLDAHTKYRSISGYGNNLKNPYWGAAGMPMGRFAPKRYDDGVHSIRKSVTGSDLPSPRKIVQNVLLRADKVERTDKVPNMMGALLVVYLSNDMAHTTPVEAANEDETIRCCSSGNKNVLSPDLLHSACAPISVGADDPFHSQGDVRCLNMIRSELAMPADSIAYGEIMNQATAFIDHSVVYGTDESQSRRIRSFENGKINMDKHNFFPVDGYGRYLETAKRLIIIPISALWPSFFARNHNKVAEELSRVNPRLNDEELFQEARRFNIAIFQHMVLGSGTIIDAVFRRKVNETYKDTTDPSISLEFITAAYRFLHFFAPSNLVLVDENEQVEEIPISDTIGRLDLLHYRYEDVIRGLIAAPLDFVQYSDEVRVL